MAPHASDVLVIGAGAAGMMAALAARGAVDRDGGRRTPHVDAPRVVALDASTRLGLKILVSGGGRCNVTNACVTTEDFDCDAPRVLRDLLQTFSPASIRTFFESRGVLLCEEPMGKLFPRSGGARDVLAALLDALREAQIQVETGAEVVSVDPAGEQWVATCADGRAYSAARLVLATGGRSLPKTGSRGFGLDAARRLGHAIAPELPALTPLLLDASSPVAGLPGITHPALLTLEIRGHPREPLARSAGSLLTTHRGISGPAALDVSGACALALQEGQDVELVADFLALTRPTAQGYAAFRENRPPGACVPLDLVPRPSTLPELLADVERLGGHGRSAVVSVLARAMPRSLAEALLRSAGLDPTRPARLLGRAAWREVHEAVCHRDLRLRAVDGYAKAEVTRGGVLLEELDAATLESRLHPGLFVCGEMVNCTGRLGGFNFQWAWSSGFAAGSGAGSRDRVR